MILLFKKKKRKQFRKKNIIEKLVSFRFSGSGINNSIFLHNKEDILGRKKIDFPGFTHTHTHTHRNVFSTFFLAPKNHLHQNKDSVC